MKVKFLEAREVKDGLGVVIQKFKVGEIAELSTASARHWINRSAAIEVQAIAQVVKEPEAAKTFADIGKDKVGAAPVVADPTSPKRGRGRPRSVLRPVQD